MKFDLKRPCKNCPFANTPDRIKFACRERAMEIEERAYRQGFVCHEHGETIENEDGDSEGIDFRADGSSQHCFGAIAMYLKNGGGNVPWENLTYDDDGALEARWWDRVDMKALATVFETQEEFYDANDPEKQHENAAPDPRRASRVGGSTSRRVRRPRVPLRRRKR